MTENTANNTLKHHIKLLLSAPATARTLPLTAQQVLRLLIARHADAGLTLRDRRTVEQALRELADAGEVKVWEDAGKVWVDSARAGEEGLDIPSQKVLGKRNARSPSPALAPTASAPTPTTDVPALLSGGTAKSRLLADIFAPDSEDFMPICTHTTREECNAFRAAQRERGDPPKGLCLMAHFIPVLRPYTDPSLGHCSYLNTCYAFNAHAPPALSNAFTHTGQALTSSSARPAHSSSSGGEKICKYLHFELEPPEGLGEPERQRLARERRARGEGSGLKRLEVGAFRGGRKYPAQFINCDLRRFDYSVLGKFQVIVADPPWDIHMSLPYGTMTDDEMRGMPIPALSDEGGLLFLWVTGRALELGRECMAIWGYKRIDEIAWLKINQLQRLIRTGRTGHWLNHTKEHCLVGIKTGPTGAVRWPEWLNRGMDVDVVVSEVRETSRKPDEVYGIIERCCPGGRKIELFGRKHNTRPGWLTLGNQLGEDRVYEPDLARRMQERYPERNIPTPVEQ